MATNRYANPGDRLFDSAGNLLSNGKLFFYTPGTTTEKAIYTTSALSVQRANPVILSGTGLIPPIFLDGEYDVVVQDKNGVQIDPGDDVNIGAAGVNLQDWTPTQNYPLDSLVIGSDDNIYISLVANNFNNNPVSTVGTSWDYFLNSGIKLSLTAGTTQTQGGATAMTASINEFSTVANTDDGGKLPSDTGIGERVMVVNNGANALKVWPATGDSINDESANAADPETIAAGASRVYTRQTATKWTYSVTSEGGRTATSTATNATLLSDVVYQEVTTTADDLEITLADATDFTAGTLAQVIANAGDKVFALRSNGNGVSFGDVFPGEVLYLWLRTNSDADGEWVVRRSDGSVDLGLPVLFEAAATGYQSSCRVGPNKTLVVYEDQGNSEHLTAVVIRWASGLTEVGAPVVIDAEACNINACCPTDVDDEAMVVAVDDSGGLNAYKLSISGTVPTLEDTRDSLATGVDNNSNVFTVSVGMVVADTFVAAYGDSNDDPAAIAFQTTGHTIGSPGTPVTGEATTAYGVKMFVTGSNEFCLGWTRQSDGSSHVERMTVSGTTITTGTAAATITTVANSISDFCQLDNGVSIVCGYDGATDNSEHLLIASGVITGGNWVEQAELIRRANMGASAGFPKVCPIGRNLAWVYMNSTSVASTALSVIVSASDDGNIKVLSQKEVSPIVASGTVSSSLYSTSYIEDGIAALTNRLGGDLNNYGYYNRALLQELLP